MFPDLEFDKHGEAHVVYTDDPSPNGACPPIAPSQCSTDTEDGDISIHQQRWRTVYRLVVTGYRERRYDRTLAGLRRTGGGAKWSRARDLGRYAPGGPDVEISIESTSTNRPVHVSRRTCCTDVFYSRKTPGDPGWFANFRVNDTPSLQDFVFTGDYTDLAANQNVLFGISAMIVAQHLDILRLRQYVRQQDHRWRRESSLISFVALGVRSRLSSPKGVGSARGLLHSSRRSHAW